MNDGVKRDVRSIAGATVFIVVGAFALYYSAYFSPLGSVFPRVVAVFMIVLSLVYVGVAMMRPGSAPQNPERGSTPRRALVAAVLFAWALLLEPLGFLVTSMLCYAAILLIANYDRWTPRRAVAYTATGLVVVGGLYALFAHVLQVPFPQGVLQGSLLR